MTTDGHGAGLSAVGSSVSREGRWELAARYVEMHRPFVLLCVARSGSPPGSLDDVGRPVGYTRLDRWGAWRKAIKNRR